MILHFKAINKPRKVDMIPREDPDQVFEPERTAIEKTHVLAVPKTAAALITLSFVAG